MKKILLLLMLSCLTHGMGTQEYGPIIDRPKQHGHECFSGKFRVKSGTSLRVANRTKYKLLISGLNSLTAIQSEEESIVDISGDTIVELVPESGAPEKYNFGNNNENIIGWMAGDWSRPAKLPHEIQPKHITISSDLVHLAWIGGPLLIK